MLDDIPGGEETEAERELAPSVDVPDASNADPWLQRQFWLLVVVFNVALLAVSLGAMFVGFQGRWSLGGRLFLAGVVLFAYGAYRFRKTKRELAARNE